MIDNVAKLRILYIVSSYKVGDGVSSAVYSQIFENVKHDYIVVSKWLYSSQENLNIIEFDEKKLLNELRHNKYDLIHYLKGINSNILNLVIKVLRKLHQDIPVLTTVCQNPNFNYLLLSPFELKHSSHFVFIDKTSYKEPLISFIPDNCKSQIYLVGNKNKVLSEGVEYVQRDDNKIIFGRGSTLSKCPKDMFDIFDKIDFPAKEFHIVGVPTEGNWVADEAKKRKNVTLYGFLTFNDWVEVCKKFDIFLYQLPEVCHASIDGTLGLAMWMKKPVIYYGSEAPKERFESGSNGFIAQTKDDIVKYANLLSKNFDLRKKIGEAGRDSIERKIGTLELRQQKYLNAYNRCINSSVKSFKIPLSYYFIYTRRAWKRIIREVTGIYARPQF